MAQMSECVFGSGAACERRGTGDGEPLGLKMHTAIVLRAEAAVPGSAAASHLHVLEQGVPAGAPARCARLEV
jgi:hypothetical protein